MELPNTSNKAGKGSVQSFLFSAKVCYSKGDFLGSAKHLRLYLAKKPDDQKARVRLIDVLKKLKDFESAIYQMEILQKNTGKKEITYKDYIERDDYQSALKLLEKYLIEDPNNLQYIIHYADTLKTVGRVDEAELAYKQAMVVNPLNGSSYWGLANMKSYKFSDDEILEMEKLLVKHELKDKSRMLINYALGKALEDKKAYSASFNAYAEANAIKSVHEPYYQENLEGFYANIKTNYTKEFFAKAAFTSALNSVATSQVTPIFIVGLPRSGSTLVEQILASHSMVDGTRELPFINQLTRNLYLNNKHGHEKYQEPSDALKLALKEPFVHYPEVGVNLTSAELIMLARFYEQKTKVLRDKAPYFTDKMPNNFMHIGLIQQILPHAKIIDIRRNPMAVGLSVFRQNFPKGLSFSNNLKDFAHFYNAYLDLMAHWDEALPDKVYHLSYEKLIENPDQEIAQLLEYCNLPFEKGCVNFHQTKRAVKTPSAEQVRQPIYKDGLEQWKNYDSELESLKNLLA
ncbi:tetratricopeptide repeat-containing sulfotransferase family protein [Catenovulum agarivorans]|uniref:tetratricopeptide repeat-containing sulfotransferase family protein n=1 Tax=Catenovulum agarivorans TaxID=1172192 RepID=UPI0002FA9D21|nr:sulfotransferase [Catenovulum agarivorans]